MPVCEPHPWYRLDTTSDSKLAQVASTAMYEFDAATELRASAPGLHTGIIRDGWDIAGVPNGGYALAFVTKAMLADVTKPDPLTVTGHYLAPLQAGPVEVEVEVIKEGRRHANAAATLRQDGREVLRALGTFYDLEAAGGAELVAARPPDLPPPEDCIGPDPEQTIPAPPFVDKVESRIRPEHAGWARGEPHGRAEIDGWLRFADGRNPDSASLPLFADGLPPAVFNTTLPVGWVPTLELTVHVRGRPAPGWLAARVRTRFLLGGYLEEDVELWSAGRLVAQSRQLALAPLAEGSLRP